MCRWIAYCGATIYLEDLVSRPEHSLIEQSLHCSEAKVNTNGDGFGVGWYSDWREPGLYRDTHPAWGDDNLKSLVRHIKAPMFFAHVRASTGTATTRANCHPFTYGRHLFMHNGQIGEYERIRRPVEALVNDELYCHRVGTTDSEAIFLALLSHGFEQNPEGAFTEVIGSVLRIMKEYDVKEAFRFSAAIANGEQLFVARYSTDKIVPSLYYRLCEGNLTVVSEPLDKEEAGWQSVPSGHLMSYNHGKIPVLTPLDI